MQPVAPRGRGARLVRYDRAGRIVVAIVALLVAVGATVLAVGSATAAEFRSGNSLTVPATETIDDDLYLTGGALDLLGNVTGDAILAGNDLRISGEVGGSVMAAVRRAELRGPIGRSVRIAGGEVIVFGPVGGDVVVFGGEVTIQPSAVVQGDVVATGGTVTVLGEVGGDVRGNADELVLDGRVGGDVRLNADEVHLLPQARVEGALRYRSRADAVVDPGAVVVGPTERREPSRYLARDNLIGWLGSAILRLLFGLIAGVVLVLIMPRAAANVADGVRRAPLASLLIGLALLVLLPIALVLLLITVVGIPVALIGLAFYLSALYLSQVFVGLAIGRALLPAAWGEDGRGFNLLAMTIGVILLALLRLIPVPFVSGAIAALTAMFGLGAIVVGLRRARRRALFAGHEAAGSSAVV